MTTFREYLAESKKTYNFKVKVAGECVPKASEIIKIALSEFDCISVSKPKRTPITETPLDFPNEKFSHVNIFDVTCNYPTTSQILAAKISEKLRVHPSSVRVRSEFEESEQNANAENYKRIGTSTEALLLKPYEETPVAYQKLVGEKRLSFLHELGKVKHAGEQYKGVNDQLLAKDTPIGSASKEKGR